MARYEELKTPEAVLAASGNGRQIEYSDGPDYGEWSAAIYTRDEDEGYISYVMSTGTRYRALIEEPAIPADNRVESEQAQITQGTCSSHCAATGECTNACAPINAQPSQQGEEEDLSRFPDEFRGDNAHLVRCIGALLSLDAKNALWPHGIGGHAKGLLSAAMHRLVSHPLPTPAEPLGRDAEGVEGLASDDVVIERHWLENIASAACLLEGSGSIIDRREGEALRKLIKSARRLRPQVDEAMADRALWVMFPSPYDEHLRKNWRPKVVEALTAALTEADSHGK